MMSWQEHELHLNDWQYAHDTGYCPKCGCLMVLYIWTDELETHRVQCLRCSSCGWLNF